MGRTIIEKCKKCDSRELSSGYGDNLSTTGPTGIWTTCKSCGWYIAIGFHGSKGDEFFDDPIGRVEDSRKHYEHINKIRKQVREKLSHEEIEVMKHWTLSDE